MPCVKNGFETLGGVTALAADPTAPGILYADRGRAGTLGRRRDRRLRAGVAPPMTKATPMTESPRAGAKDARADATSPARDRRPRRWTRWLPWVLTVLALAAAVTSTWQWRQLATERAAVASARTAAVEFTRDLTNWDASDGLEDEIDVLRGQGTGPFLDEIEFVFGGDELTSQLEDDGVSADGDVQEAFVQDVEGDVADVFVVVDVTYSATEIETSMEPVTFAASLALERADDGTWLVREVTIPNSNQIGNLMAPPTEES
jgi:hypothetical protein